MAEAVDGALALTTTSASWSPTVTASGGAGSWAVTSHCRAVKTGKEVMLEGSINITSTAPVGNLNVAGLPYLPDSQFPYTCGLLAAYTGLTLPSGYNQVGLLPLVGAGASASFTLVGSGSANTTTVLDLSAALALGFAAIYFQYRYQTT